MCFKFQCGSELRKRLVYAKAKLVGYESAELETPPRGHVTESGPESLPLMIARPLLQILASLLWCGLTHAVDKPALPHQMLFDVVQVCAQTHLLAGSPLPCLAVEYDSLSARGFAVVPVPDAAEVLLVPLLRVTGIESAKILLPDSPNWWQHAWEARRFLLERAPRIAEDRVVLAVNSQRSRSQDQLHIHVACIDPAILSELRHFVRKIHGSWSKVPLRLGSQRWLALRLEGRELLANPFTLLAGMDVRLRGPMADWGLAVIPWTFSDIGPGFIVLATRTTGRQGETGAVSDIIDPQCAAD